MLKKIDMSLPDYPSIVSSIEITDMKTDYCLIIDGKRVRYPYVVSGIILYKDNIILCTRLKASSMSNLYDDTQVTGHIVLLNKNDLSIIDMLKFNSRTMCACPSMYKDVLIVGFVQGGYGAYKITDGGLVELLRVAKTDNATELEFQGCCADDESGIVAFALYKYGIREYQIEYDGNESFSMTRIDQLRFVSYDDFLYDTEFSIFSTFSTIIHDGYVIAPLARVKSVYIPKDKQHIGLIVCELGNLENYKFYSLPSDAIPDEPLDNGTDPQPTCLSLENNRILINLGNKGIGLYTFENGIATYIGRFGAVKGTETELVQWIGNKPYTFYRRNNDTSKQFIKSFKFVEKMI